MRESDEEKKNEGRTAEKNKAARGKVQKGTQKGRRIKGTTQRRGKKDGGKEKLK